MPKLSRQAWRNKPDYTTLHQSSQSAQRSSGSSWYRMDVSSIVTNWIDGIYLNYGFALVDSVENDPDHWTTLYSSDADSPHKPALHIYYSGDEIPSTPTTPTSNAVLVGVTNTNHDHASWMTSVKSSLESCGYSVTRHTGAFTASNINSYITSSQNSVFVSRSHGDAIIDSTGETEILLYTCLRLDDSTNGTIYASTNIPNGITNMDLIAFVGCYTGYGGNGAENLPTYAVSKGAETAIGFPGQIVCASANTWTNEFFILLKDGYSVFEAVDFLESADYTVAGNLTSSVICGNSNLTIN